MLFHLCQIEKALAIAIEIGDRKGEEAHCVNLGTLFRSFGDYVKAKEYLEKALAIGIEIGEKEGQTNSRVSLGRVLLSLGLSYADANKYFEEELRFATESGDSSVEALCYSGLGSLFQRLGDNVKVKGYYCVWKLVTEQKKHIFTLT